MSREQGVRDAMIELTDTLAGTVEIVDLMRRLADHCVDLLGVDAAAALLADSRGGLRMVVSSNERAELLNLSGLQSDEGPALESFRRGEAIGAADLATILNRWPRFAPEVLRQGYRSVQGIPLRLRDEIIGALALFADEAGSIREEHRTIARALADAATIGILHKRALRRSEVLLEQLRATRIVVPATSRGLSGA